MLSTLKHAFLAIPVTSIKKGSMAFDLQLERVICGL